MSQALKQTQKKVLNIRELSNAIQCGDIQVESYVNNSLEKAKQSESVFISISENIIDQARSVDRAIQSGKALPKLSGIPISLKDLFDVKGEITLAGSRALKHIATPAQQDCDVVVPLRSAGLLFLGRTNMSEFAFSGMGMNPHYGTPKCIWDRQTGRLPGGSSSGSGVSVAEQIVPATMGSDTAGSCRIPAAFNGIVGVKPSHGRLPLKGVYPLSPTSDAPGPMAVDVDSCFLLDQLISGTWDGNGALPELVPKECAQLRLILPQGVVMDELDDEVADNFHRAVAALKDSGVTVINMPMPMIDQCVEMFMTRAIAGYESAQHHGEMLEKYGEEYDPFVFKRITSFKQISEQEQQARYADKARLKNEFEKQMKEIAADGVIYPTTACIPPSIAAAQVVEDTAKVNLRNLRNTSSANYFDGCSMSLPCHNYDEAPSGLMISSVHSDDAALYQVAVALESVIEQLRE